MIIYRNELKNAVVIEGHPNTYPLGSLTASWVDAKGVLTDANGIDVVSVPLSRLQDGNGQTFTSETLALEYLERVIKPLYATKDELETAMNDHLTNYHPLYSSLPKA